MEEEELMKEKIENKRILVNRKAQNSTLKKYLRKKKIKMILKQRDREKQKQISGFKFHQKQIKCLMHKISLQSKALIVELNDYKIQVAVNEKKHQKYNKDNKICKSSSEE